MSKETNTLAITIAKRRENQSHLVLLKIKEGRVRILFEESFPGTVYPYSFNGLLWLYHTSMNQPAKLTAHSIDSKILKVHEVCFYKREVEELIDFDYEYLEYESFDGKKVPALLSLPPGKIRAAYIISFYGGTNSFYKAEAIFAKYGIACLSPAVRGSWEYGKEWRDFIKGDLGGNEIVDLIWGAKFLEKRLNLKPSQIGVMGGSHGGYATLRALTFPESFNGVNTRYDWGFGICSAGFADLIDFYKTSNIPDWLDDMLGSYKDNEDKYIERSPLHNFERLRTPLMIEHGTNDTRVPYSTMTHFVDKLEKSNIPHEIIIKEGSGHNYSSAKEEAEVYEKEISFILRHIK
jgi:dipeptidyl aminopeptidase/acylaminoacyl peptidase